MSWKTMLALLLVVGVLLLLHSLMHIDPNQPPPKVILSLEVALISLLLIDVIWGHLVHFLQVLTNQAHGAAPALSTQSIYAIMWAFVASVLLYLLAFVLSGRIQVTPG